MYQDTHFYYKGVSIKLREINKCRADVSEQTPTDPLISLVPHSSSNRLDLRDIVTKSL